ncbi:hypothetical protein Tco_1125163, partial [Tanacetum coccineum]
MTRKLVVWNKKSIVLFTTESKDKGKAKMIEPEKPLKKKDHIKFDEEVAKRLAEELEAELEEEERVIIQREEEANLILWDNNQAMMEADYELAQRLQEEEHGELTIEERSRLFVELMDKRKKHFAKLRAKKIKRKPYTKAQKKDSMSTYLKNMAGFKHTQLKNKSFKEIQMLFDKEMKRVNSFVYMDLEVVEGSRTKTKSSRKDTVSKKRAGKELDEENTGITIYMLVERKYSLIQEMLSRMLSTRLRVDHECEMAYELLRFTKITAKKLSISTAGEDCRKYSKSLLLLVLVTTARRVSAISYKLIFESDILDSNKMTLDIHNWSSSAHQEIHKIIKDEIFPIVNQVDARVQNFEIQFLKEAAKFVRDFKSLAKEADESIAKHKALELEIERLLREVVSQDIMSIVNVKNANMTKFHTIKLITTCNKRSNGCKLSWEIKKGKSKDTPCVSDTLDPLSQKLENENVELEFQVLNYAKENAHLKTTYKNLFDSIKVTRAQTKAIIDSLQDKLHDTIYENAKLRAQLFDKVSEQKDTNKGTSVNTQFLKQSILAKPPSSSEPKLYLVNPFPKSTVIPKVGKSNALSKPVTSNSAPSSRESTVVNNERVIAPGIFRINPFKASRVDNFVPNKHVKASVRTKPITVSQPHVVTKEDVNSNRNGFSPNNFESTTRTRRPQPRNNLKNDKVPFKSKNSCLSNKLEKKEENHRS